MTGNMTIMFIVGFVIFSLYIWGLLTMITKAHKKQKTDLENDPELRGFDWEHYHQYREERYYKSPSRKKRKRKKFQKVVNGKKEV